MDGTYSVLFYDELDADFGYGAWPRTYMSGLDKNVAEGIARNMNRVTPESMDYFTLADYDDERKTIVF